MKPTGEQFLAIRCEHLLYEAGCISVPTDLRALARHLGVAQIEIAEIDTEGSVQRVGDNLIIKIRKGMPGTRQRFTLAHELAHVIIDEVTRKTESKDYAKYSRFACVKPVMCEEGLANHLASVLVLPTWFMQRRLAGSVRLSDLSRAARDARVSLSAAMLRSVQLATAPSVVFLAKCVGDGWPQLKWVDASRGLSVSKAKEDLGDSRVLDSLITYGEVHASSLHYDWHSCEFEIRKFNQVQQIYGFASLSNEEVALAR